eukprot:tig00020927_g15957.t1
MDSAAELPDELLQLAVALLPPREILCSVALVSRRFRAIAERAFASDLRELDVRCARVEDAWLARTVARAAGAERLSVRFSSIVVTSQECWDALFDPDSTRSSTPLHVYIEACEVVLEGATAAREVRLPRLDRVERLELWSLRLPRGARLATRALRGAGRLRRLLVSDARLGPHDAALTDVAREAPALESLAMPNCRAQQGLTCEGLGALLERNPGIRDLDLTMILQWRDASPVVSLLAERCRSLRALALGFVDVADGPLAALATACPALERLQIPGCSRFLTQEGLGAALRALPRLTDLDLSWCALSDPVVDALTATAGPRLRSLAFSSTVALHPSDAAAALLAARPAPPSPLSPPQPPLTPAGQLVAAAGPARLRCLAVEGPRRASWRPACRGCRPSPASTSWGGPPPPAALAALADALGPSLQARPGPAPPAPRAPPPRPDARTLTPQELSVEEAGLVPGALEALLGALGGPPWPRLAALGPFSPWPAPAPRPPGDPVFAL